MALEELTSPDAVLQAIHEYERLGQDAFLGKYGFRPARNCLLLHEGERYDSKAIAGAAHGYQYPDRGPLRPGDFNGGAPTVSALEALGFEVERTNLTEQDALSLGIEEVLISYSDARTQQPFGKQAPIWQTFVGLNDAFSASPPVRGRSTVSATWSAGLGNSARVPWVALLDSRETSTTQRVVISMTGVIDPV
jgi:hypothetical protein